MTTADIRKYMELSVEVMKSSVQEARSDAKPSPYVGAVLVRNDGSVVTAYRGELREGDHAFAANNHRMQQGFSGCGQ